VAIDIVKEINVLLKVPTELSDKGPVHGEKVISHVTSESSDVSFHTVEDVASVPSDLEVSGTDEEMSVF
jgi:hypothetical protein